MTDKRIMILKPIYSTHSPTKKAPSMYMTISKSQKAVMKASVLCKPKY